MFQLYCKEGPLKGQTFDLPLIEVISIGRQNENDLIFDSPKMSRKHAQLIQHGDFLYLKDLGSQNGVYLNGKRVNNPSVEMAIELKLGDEIGIGDFVFQIKQGNSTSDATADATHEMLRNTYRSLANSSNIETFYENIALQIIQNLQSERICFMDFNAAEKTLNPQYFATLSDLGPQAHFEPSMMVLHHIMNEKKTIFTIDAGSDDRFKDGQSIVDAGVRSIICSPYLHKNELLGAVYLDTLQSENSFGENDKVQIESLSELLTLALLHFRNLNI